MTKWMVSICTKSPGKRASGRGSEKCHRFQGLRYLINPLRFRVRFTLERLTTIPWFNSSRWIISAHRFRFLRWLTMASTISFFNALGWVFVAEDSVGMWVFKCLGAFFNHLMTAQCEKPRYRATFRIAQPFLTSFTASVLTRGK